MLSFQPLRLLNSLASIVRILWHLAIDAKEFHDVSALESRLIQLILANPFLSADHHLNSIENWSWVCRIKVQSLIFCKSRSVVCGVLTAVPGSRIYIYITESLLITTVRQFPRNVRPRRCAAYKQKERYMKSSYESTKKNWSMCCIYKCSLQPARKWIKYCRYWGTVLILFSYSNRNNPAAIE